MGDNMLPPARRLQVRVTVAACPRSAPFFAAQPAREASLRVASNAFEAHEAAGGFGQERSETAVSHTSLLRSTEWYFDLRIARVFYKAAILPFEVFCLEHRTRMLPELRKKPHAADVFVLSIASAETALRTLC